MKNVLRLAWRYVAYHKAKTAILTVCLMLTAVLPLAAHLLISTYGESLTARARATPLVIGAKGNRFDLVLKALYFSKARVEPVRMATVDAITDGGLALPIPLHLRYTARGYPVVGTTLDYFDFRGLRLARGTGLRALGEAVIGAHVAQRERLGPGDSIYSDQSNIYDISKTYPLKMHIVGVLAETNTPDDEAVFVDLKTAWIIDGIIHGHGDVVKNPNPNVVLKKEKENVVTNAAIVEYQEVTPENIRYFHMHGERADLPLSAIVVVPHDRKSATMLKAHFSMSQTVRVLDPAKVVRELLGLVFRVKRFFDANFALITVSTALFIVLVVMLSYRLRKREMETMFKIGCSRSMTFWLQAAELGIVLVMGLGLAGVAAVGIVRAVPYFVRGL